MKIPSLIYFSLGLFLLLQFSCKGGAFVEDPSLAGTIFEAKDLSLSTSIVADSLFTDLGEGLKLYISHEGEGEQVREGSNVMLHYIGLLDSGQEFDNSLKRKSPLNFIPGKGKAIKGWEMAIPKLRFGSKAILIIPPALAYGSEGQKPQIPPNATLTFYIHVIGAF